MMQMCSKRLCFHYTWHVFMTVFMIFVAPFFFQGQIRNIDKDLTKRQFKRKKVWKHKFFCFWISQSLPACTFVLLYFSFLFSCIFMSSLNIASILVCYFSVCNFVISVCNFNTSICFSVVLALKFLIFAFEFPNYFQTVYVLYCGDHWGY